jgi:MFS family permease
MTAPATRVRYSILFLLCLLAMITYMDRAMYGSAKDDLMKSVGRDPADFFYVLVAFQLAYALFEIPTGWLGDTFGPRSTLLRIVLWWSLFVALTGFAGWALPGGKIVVIGFGVLIAMQFLFGMGEAGAFPNISKALYNWFPTSERGFAKGAIWMSARFMGGLTPFVWVLLVDLGGLSWRQALWLFAGIATIWCVVFWWWFKNTPAEHPATNEAERALAAHVGHHDAHTGVPWRKLFTSRNLWAVCLMYMVTNFNWYFLMYYLPKTLKDQFPDWKSSSGGLLLLALLGGAPLLVGMFGCYLGGVLTDRHLARTGDRKWARRTYAMIGYGLAGVSYAAAAGVLLGPQFDNKLWVFAGMLMLVGFFNDLIMASSWATCQDIGRRYAAIVSGTMNMVGNLGATLGNYVTGKILKANTVNETVQDNGYITCFLLYAVVYSLGVVAWLFIDATKPVVPDEPSVR